VFAGVDVRDFGIISGSVTCYEFNFINVQSKVEGAFVTDEF
jgi:hypothetical protein